MSRIILVGCGRKKVQTRRAARDLYGGGLFRARRAYAEASGVSWFIISAGLGLLDPRELVEPYDVTMRGLTDLNRAAWPLRIALDLLSALPDPVRRRDVSVEIHAGADYAGELEDVLRAVGLSALTPVKGLGLGEQLSWYGRRKHLARP